MFDLLDNLVPMVILFMLLRGILDVLFGKKKRRPDEAEEGEELPPDYEGERQPQPEYEANTKPVPQEKKPDLAAEFERRLKKRQQEPSKEAQKVRQDKQRVHYDGEIHHESKGRVHRENEALQHDKSKVFRDPRGDYSYNEERFNKEAAAFAARYSQQEQQAKPKVKLKHTALVNGFIMAQVLDKPRSLKPYGTEEI
ncbi:MAG: hypothetical protein ACI3WU_01825 [Phascolarctobacterium sp.]